MKVKNFKEIKKIVEDLKKKNKKIVTTNGVFDILHVGHVRFLEKAKQLGDVLIVGINSNESTKKFKGDSRPINDEKDRAEIIAALRCVDYVFIFNELDPRKFLSILRPNIHVKDKNYKKHAIIELDVIKNYGGAFKQINSTKGYSTTKFIEKIKKS